MIVRMWMSSNLITVTPETEVAQAFQLITKHKIRRLLVLSQGKLAGLVTVTDLSRASQLPNTKIADLMSTQVATIAPEAPIEEAGALMKNRKIRTLPVVKDGKLVGIITETDIFRAMFEILGLNEKGHRITAEFSKNPDRFYELIQTCRDANASLLSVAVYKNYSKEKGVVVLRVPESQAKILVEKLRDAKFMVL